MCGLEYHCTNVREAVASWMVSAGRSESQNCLMAMVESLLPRNDDKRDDKREKEELIF